MIIVKTKSFIREDDIAKFINVNNIARENILSITVVYEGLGTSYVIFFYGDSEKEEIGPGFFGWKS